MVVEQVCPECGCTIFDESYGSYGALYCCESCARGDGQCDCGCRPATRKKPKADMPDGKIKIISETLRGREKCYG